MILFPCFISRSRDDYSPPIQSCQSEEATIGQKYDLLMNNDFIDIIKAVVREFSGKNLLEQSHSY